jgi:hypothetical protein
MAEQAKEQRQAGRQAAEDSTPRFESIGWRRPRLRSPNIDPRNVAARAEQQAWRAGHRAPGKAVCKESKRNQHHRRPFQHQHGSQLHPLLLTAAISAPSPAREGRSVGAASSSAQ